MLQSPTLLLTFLSPNKTDLQTEWALSTITISRCIWVLRPHLTSTAQSAIVSDCGPGSSSATSKSRSRQNHNEKPSDWPKGNSLWGLDWLAFLREKAVDNIQSSSNVMRTGQPAASPESIRQLEKCPRVEESSRQTKDKCLSLISRQIHNPHKSSTFTCLNFWGLRP